MPDYLHPGVYIEEQPAQQTIEGVSTSTAGMVGATEMGPVEGLPKLVTNFSEFQGIYGGFLPEQPWGNTRFLAYAVQGFFQNGGQRVYIKRVVNEATTASASLILSNGYLEGGISYLLTRLAEDLSTDEASAVLVSSRGIERGSQIVLVQEGVPDLPQTVDALDSNKVTLSGSTRSTKYRKSDLVMIPVADLEVGNALQLETRDPGIWGNQIRVAVTPSSQTSTTLLGLGLSTSLTPQSIALTLGSIAADNIRVTLGAGETANLREGDRLRFGNGTDAAPQERAIIPGGITGDQVTLNAPLETMAPAINQVEVLVALRINATTDLRPLFALTLGSIAADNTTVTLGAGETANLREGDRLRFSNATDAAPQERTIIPGGITGDQVTLNAPLQPMAPAIDQVEVLVALRVNAETTSVTVNIEATPGFQRNDRVMIEDSDGAVSGVISADPPASHDSLTLTLDDPFPVVRQLRVGTVLRLSRVTRTVNIEPTPGFQRNDRVVIEDDAGTTSAVVSADPPASNNSLTLTLDNPRDIPSGATLRLRNAGRGNNTIRVAGARNLYVGGAVEIENADDERIYATVTAINGEQVQLDEDVPSSYLEGDLLRTCEFDLTVQWVKKDPATLRENIVREENHRYLSLADGAMSHAVTRINKDSKLLKTDLLNNTNSPPFNFPNTIVRSNFNSYQYLQNGSDGLPPQPVHYRGTDNGPGKRTGIVALEDIDDISMIAAPGMTDSVVQSALIEQCTILKDRFAILDSPPGSDKEAIKQHRGQYDTLYAALYYPWVKVFDPLQPSRAGLLSPPSGHVMGIYADVDTKRGVYKAPANEVIQGITDIEFKLSDREQDDLNPQNINVIRDFRNNNRGIRVWGSRCLTSDSAWKYVPVRRLFIFLEESLDEGLQWVVFEPNGEALWARVRRTISGFLRTLWLSGALAGVSEEEAFFVKCDRTTMTQDDIDNGRLIILVGAAPLKPAEFVIVQVSQKTLEAAS
jgi:phage tail sheath protein FI